jgi:hypothetical protein
MVIVSRAGYFTIHESSILPYFLGPDIGQSNILIYLTRGLPTDFISHRGRGYSAIILIKPPHAALSGAPWSRYRTKAGRSL